MEALQVLVGISKVFLLKILNHLSIHSPKIQSTMQYMMKVEFTAMVANLVMLNWGNIFFFNRTKLLKFVQMIKINVVLKRVVEMQMLLVLDMILNLLRLYIQKMLRFFEFFLIDD